MAGMSERQRQSLVDLMTSILACRCCPPDIRFRAENLLAKLRPQASDIWGRFFGGVR